MGIHSKMIDNEFATSAFQDHVLKNYIDVPNTLIKNRAQIVDPSTTLEPSLGVRRMVFQSLEEVNGEFGPSNEIVHRPMNSQADIHLDAIRVIGFSANLNDANGPRVGSSSLTYIEVTFYGTGLNMLCMQNNNSFDYRATVDGGAEGTNFAHTSGSNILTSLTYSVNQVLPVVSGLTLGLHTVRIRRVTQFLNFSGFEFLNETAGTVSISPGTAFINGVKSVAATAQSVDYTTAVTGTRGGRAAVYLKQDGTCGTAFQAAAASQLNLGSSDHVAANETLIRAYHWREFGNGLGNDFSLLFTTPVRDAMASLSDGTTTLTAEDVSEDVAYTGGLLTDSGTTTINFTFVGTGVSIKRRDSAAAGGATNLSWYLDSAFLGIEPATGILETRITPIVSGLPYGTHVLRFDYVTSPNWKPIILEYHVYGPKEPTIPAGTMKLADFFVMADFVGNTVTGLTTMSTGVLRKEPARESIYVGTGWQINAAADLHPTGRNVYTNILNDYFERTFFGTGFDYRFRVSSGSANTNAATFTLDGVALTTANFPGLAVTIAGAGISYNTTTGVADLNDSTLRDGNSVAIAGLPLGSYTLKIRTDEAAFLQHQAIDIITPIHFPQDLSPANLQNNLSVGSMNLGDSRNFSPNDNDISPNWSEAVGVVNGPTSATTVPVPLNDMMVAIKTNGNPIRVSWSCDVLNTTLNASMTVMAKIDGVTYTTDWRNGVNQSRTSLSFSRVFHVGPGVHTAQLFFYAGGGGTVQALARNRQLRIEEVK